MLNFIRRASNTPALQNLRKVEEVLSLIKSHKKEVQGKPQAVLDLIDDYASKNGLMNVGPAKGAYIKKEISHVKPEIIIELGTHTGYSSIMMANELTKVSSGGAKIHSFDVNPKFVEYSSEIINIAGLQDRIVQHNGKAGDLLKQFQIDYQVEKADLVFIDHWKDAYVPDLRVLETLGLVTQGTSILADNIRNSGGTQEYVQYVGATPQWRKEYNERVSNVNGNRFVGKWGLVYESDIFYPPGSDGIELTRCVGILDA